MRLIIEIMTMDNVDGVNFNEIYNTTGKPVELFQTSYWVSLKIFDKTYDNKSNKFLFENCTFDNEKYRLSFNFYLDIKVSLNTQLRNLCREGVIVHIWKSEPLIEVNTQNIPNEKKPVLKVI